MTNDNIPSFRKAHGVTHHGDTYRLTAEQEAMIEKLTREDVELYRMVQDTMISLLMRRDD